MNDLPVRNQNSRENKEKDEVKELLLNKYRNIFIDKLTPADLEELQYYLKRQFNENRGINKDYKSKFESKLREFLHEEILTREIVSIEVLLNRLRPDDLKQQSG